MLEHRLLQEVTTRMSMQINVKQNLAHSTWPNRITTQKLSQLMATYHYIECCWIPTTYPMHNKMTRDLRIFNIYSKFPILLYNFFFPYIFYLFWLIFFYSSLLIKCLGIQISQMCIQCKRKAKQKFRFFLH